LPLVVGPLLCAAGFALCALPSAGGSYWSTFFPAIIVLGLGLAVTVAPLTTTVMNSVDIDHAGAASGINNAVARVSGLLAVAILGATMVSTFGQRLHRELDQLPIPQNVAATIEANHTRLAAIPIPENLDSDAKTLLRRAIEYAFVHAFRIVLVICAGLALLSAVIAWFVIRA
jgi:MFS family permease